jgi:G3E family GTPase
MQQTRVILVGGFLGAGKTTTIARLARAYLSRGLKVGIVTNDQATDLVDTLTLRNQGFHVGEVAGACFCCNFNQFTKTVATLEEKEHPDVVLAEPVGSCTDLVATVIQPLAQLYPQKFSIAPYGVILKPSHGRRILGGGENAGFSPKAAYIFQKQLEEADFLIINRTDELQPQEVERLQQMLEAAAPETTVLRVSAKTGAGFDNLLEILDQDGAFGTRILEVDYDVYAEGEAELGWLNSSLKLQSEKPFALDDALLRIVSRLKETLETKSAEIAHLKTIGMWEGYHGVANLVSSDAEVELSIPSSCETKLADVVVNARVATSPELLQELVDDAIEKACQAVGATAKSLQTQSFRPGRPVPTHRIESLSGPADG